VVPPESVSKMLGHESLKTSLHYAKISDRKVSEYIMVSKNKLKRQNLNDDSLSNLSFKTLS
jgi:hypothetical protein